MRWPFCQTATGLLLVILLISSNDWNLAIQKVVCGQRWGPKPSTCLSLIKSISGAVRDDEGWFKVDIENEPKFYVPSERYTGKDEHSSDNYWIISAKASFTRTIEFILILSCG